MKKGFLFTFLLFSSQVFSFQYQDNPTFVFSEFLFWQVREAADDNWAQILGPTSTQQDIKFLNVPFKWSPGFRLGIGYHDTEKPWNVVLYYTGFKTKGVNQANIDSGEIHSSFSGNFYADNPLGDGISGPYYHQAGIQWKVLFDTLDLELGRPFKINTILELRPFVGLKAGIINQNMNTSWQTPFKPTTRENPNPTPITTFSAATETITNHFKGVGPSFGLDSTWHLYDAPKHAFNLLGNFSGAFLWGRWNLSDVYQNNTPVSITIKNDSLSTTSTMAKGYLGLEWVSHLNKAELNIRLGYEGQIWFNQLKYYSFDMGKTNDSLTIHGGVLSLCIHF